MMYFNYIHFQLLWDPPPTPAYTSQLIIASCMCIGVCGIGVGEGKLLVKLTC